MSICSREKVNFLHYVISSSPGDWNFTSRMEMKETLEEGSLFEEDNSRERE